MIITLLFDKKKIILLMNNKVEHVQTFNHKSQGIFSSNGKKKESICSYIPNSLNMLRAL